MKENEEQDWDDLIAKVLTGEASPEERVKLDTWVQLSVENRKYVDQIKTIFEKASTPGAEIRFDANAAWVKMRKQLQNAERREAGPGPDPRRIVPWNVLRIAAGVAIILAAGIFIYRFRSQPVETFALNSDQTTRQDTLPDGSTAFLNKKSSITYEYNPRQNIRVVKLKGEGFFEVKHKEERPFVIETGEVMVRDIGTTFNVRAYPASDTVDVVVEKGEVQLYTASNEGLRLKAGERGIYSKRLREFSKLEKADTNVLAYKTGILSFNNTYLKTVVENINELYDARIRLENPALGTCRLTVNFHGDSLDTIVEVIAETLKLTVTRDKKEILLSGPGCN